MNRVADGIGKAAWRAIVFSDVLLYREGVAAGIAHLGNFAVAGMCDAAGLGEMLRTYAPELLFIDLSARELETTVNVARNARPAIIIVGFGMKSHEEGLAAARAGLTAFVDHGGTLEDLDRVACEAMAGRPYCPPAFAARLLAQIAGRSHAQPAGGIHLLTSRERDVARLVTQGLSNKEIASSLKISPATVKNHVHIILEKLDVPSRRMIGLRSENRVA